MKKLTLAITTVAALLGLAALSPASAVPASQLGASSHSNVVDVQYRRDRRQHCNVRTVVSREHGRKIVRKVRTCR